MVELKFTVSEEVAKSFRTLAASLNVSEDEFFRLCVGVSLPIISKRIRKKH